MARGLNINKYWPFDTIFTGLAGNWLYQVFFPFSSTKTSFTLQLFIKTKVRWPWPQCVCQARNHEKFPENRLCLLYLVITISINIVEGTTKFDLYNGAEIFSKEVESCIPTSEYVMPVKICVSLAPRVYAWLRQNIPCMAIGQMAKPPMCVVLVLALDASGVELRQRVRWARWPRKVKMGLPWLTFTWARGSRIPQIATLLNLHQSSFMFGERKTRNWNFLV